MMQGMLVRQLLRKKKPFSSSSASKSRAFRVIEAPSLLDLDLPDIWASNPSETTNHHLPLRRNGDKPLFACHPEGRDKIAAVIDGKSISDEILSGIADEVRRMKNSIGKVPGLAVVLVGQRRDSQTYVRNKVKACEEAGFMSLLEELSDNCGEDEVLTAVQNFNDNPSVHGVLVQLPLPQHMDEEKILNAVSLQKDVDGFHPLNTGNLAMTGREPLFIPCTPKGCIELLVRSGVEIMGKKAAVIGRSNIVGLPVSLLLQRHHATVTVLHAFSKNPEVITRQADIVISAVGVANLVRGSWLKPGAVVIDVGTNPVEDPNSEHGYQLVGDVCYDEAVKVASAITPVPGGVGPMTIAMLLANTLDSAKRSYMFG